jgi:uncharacterized SAM-binding protein YcdF (DUF218 family)
VKQSWLCGLLLGACSSTMPVMAQVDADAILVLGHRPPLRDGVIEQELQARVDHGIALYRAGRAPLMLMSGGASTQGAIEADVMAAHAERAGVPRAAILRERTSRDTIENARFSIALLRAKVGRTPRVVLVTSDYHSERAAKLVTCAGAEVEAAPVDPQLSAPERKRRLRSERWIRAYYGLIDECRRALGR